MDDPADLTSPSGRTDEPWPPHAATGAGSLPPEATQGPVTNRSRVLRAVGVLATISAVIAGGLFALDSLAARDGASTPAAAVHQLLNAASRSDLLGVLDALPPSERRELRSSSVEIAQQLQRLGLLAKGTNLSQVPGVGMRFDNVTTVTQALGHGIADVKLTGGVVHTSLDPTRLPYGPLLTETVLHGKPPGRPQDKATEIGNGDDVVLTTVQEGGGWHVSLWYSIAENLRRHAHTPAPDFGAGVPAEGSPNPEAAVRSLIDAATSLDLHRMIALTAPDEARALHDYGPLFLSDAQRSANAARATGLKVTVDNLQLRAATDGSHSRVTISAFDAKLHEGSTTTTATYDGHCLKIAKTALSSPAISTCDHSTGGTMGLGMLPLLGSQPPFAFTTVQVGGLWYISPTATVTDGILEMLRGLDQAKLRSWLQHFAGPFHSVSGGRSAPPVPAAASALRSCFAAALPAPATNPNSSPIGSTVLSPAARQAAIAACLRAAVASGKLPAASVPLPYRVPECFPPLQFTPGATPAQNRAAELSRQALTSSCLQAKIADGQLPAGAVPGYYLHPGVPVTQAAATTTG